MITRASRDLAYVGRLRTDAWIMRATGIPLGTIGFVRSGMWKLPAQYKASLRNLYQREAYNALRDVGFSFHQARRFSWYTPERVTEISATMENVIEELAVGRTGVQIDKLEKIGLPYSAEEIYFESLGIMKKAIEDSPKPIEDIEDYLTG